jgi:hypothetical protein
LSSDVTFTFTLANMRSASTTAQYNDAPQSYSRVRDVNDRMVWR